MPTVEDVRAALELLMDDTTETIAVIDQEIESHKKALNQLMSYRKMLFGGPAKPERQVKLSTGDGKIRSHYVEIEEKIVEFVKAHGEELPSAIASAIGSVSIVVGKVVASSDRLMKRGAYVTLASDE